MHCIGAHFIMYLYMNKEMSEGGKSHAGYPLQLCQCWKAKDCGKLSEGTGHTVIKGRARC